MFKLYFPTPLVALLLLATTPRLTQAQTTGGVGIGTTAPDASAALDIVSSTKGALLPRLTQAQVGAIASPATGLLVFQTDGLAGFYYNAGTPAAPSWQQLTTATATGLSFGNGLTQTGSAVGLGGTLGQNTTLGLAGYVLGLTGGNVGIGTTAPGAGLHVRTDEKASASNTTGIFLSGGASGNPNIELRGTNGATYLDFANDLTADYTARILSISTGLGFYTTLTSGPTLFLNGNNVGIGTTAPLTRLSISQATAVNGTPGQNLGELSFVGFNRPRPSASIQVLSKAFDDTGHLLFKTSPDGNGAIEQMRLTADGNVGIGTSTPGQKLEVAGQVYSNAGGFRFPDNTVQVTAASGTGFIQNGTSPQSASFNVSGAGTVGGLLTAGSGQVSGLLTAGSGQVSGLLTAGSGQVSGLLTAGSLAASSTGRISSQGAYLHWNRSKGDGETWLLNQQGSGLGGIRFGAADAVSTGTNTVTEWARFDGQGNLGLGTTTPGQKLEVAGTAASLAAGTQGMLRLTRPGTAGTKFGNAFDVQVGSYGTTAPSQTQVDFRLNNGNTQTPDMTALSLRGNGSVGIGTAAPEASAALDVSSTAKGLLPPRLSQAQRDAIASPATGLTLYNTSTGKLNVWNGTGWDASLSAAEQPTQNSTVTFTASGGPQSYVVPAGVTRLTVTATGAQGGSIFNVDRGQNALGGPGAQVQATLLVVPGETLGVYVGGVGNANASTSGSAPGGYNGGGGISFVGGSGGGATDLRRGSTKLLVAAGGGGCGYFANANGGGGGAPNGAAGVGNAPGTGATQAAGGSAGGSLGQGGTAISGSSGGGGGGYYGGGGGGTSNFREGSGGGGSSWVTPTGTAITMTAATNFGNGALTIAPAPAYSAPALDGTQFTNVASDNGLLARGWRVITEQGGHLQWNRSGGLGETWLINQQGGGSGGIFFGKADQSNNVTEWARFDGSGNLGIGTTNPGHPLTVQAGAASNSPLLGFYSPTGADKYNFSLAGGGLNLSESGVAGGRLFVQDGGNVGIGTTSPIARLHVSGSAQATPTGGNTSYFSGGSALIGPQPPGGTTARATAAYFDGGQVWVNSTIVAGALNTTSDRRIKHVIGLSDRAADLALLQRLRITDYTYIDQQANPAGIIKKVIAQEVEQVLPTAVSRSTQALPNVYEKATQVRYAQGQVTVTTVKPHELPASGGRMRFYSPTNESLDVAVTVVDAHTVRFASTEAYASGLFVYGKYVDDFRSVDYDALTTLNVSATQELARKVEALEQQNAALQAKASAAEAKATKATSEASEAKTQAARATATTEAFEARLRRLEAGSAQAQR